MRLRPALLLAAPAGVLGGHAIGYVAAPGPGGAHALHHGYLALALSIAVPLAVLAVAWAAAEGATGRGTRTGAARSAPVGLLLTAQWMLFTGQEVVEHALAGHGPAAALQSRALWWGLAAQVVTALAVIFLLRVSAATGARLVTLAGRALLVVHRLLPWRPARPASAPPPAFVCACPARGPPAGRFA